MRAFFGLAALLAALVIVGLAARQMLVSHRPATAPAAATDNAPAVRPAPGTAPKATVDQVRRDLDRATQAGADRAADADR